MRYFPIFADLERADVLVVGGGEQAAQKVRLLAKTAARITLIAETVTPELAELEHQGAITIARRPFAAADLDGKRLAYAATGDRSSVSSCDSASRTSRYAFSKARR
jgi:uroporphyrin-III C-methyltransferase/precorrin-2 dehydrogenase/sirohydrochlorin ferrochelatase